MLVIPEISVASFKDEFDKARKAGKKEFTWRGKRYNTLKKGEKLDKKRPERKDGKVQLAPGEKNKNSLKRTRFDYAPEKRKIDKTLKKSAKGLGKDINITSGDRAILSSASRKNHSEQKARDIGFRSNPQLSKSDIDTIAMQAVRDGLRVGGDTRHLHLDDRKAERAKDIFSEDGQDHSFLKSARIAKDDVRGIISRAKDYVPKEAEDKVEKKVKDILSPKKEAPKGMDQTLRDKLAFLSLSNPQDENFGKQYKAIMDGNIQEEIDKQVEAAPKVASTGKVEMKSKKEREEDLINEIASGGLSKEKDSPKKDLVKAQAVAQVEKQSIEELKNPAQQPVQRNKIKQNRPSPKSEFQEAMNFFLPTIIGGLGGALFEGTEGAIAGAEAGTSLGESFRDYKMKKYEMEKGKAKKDYTSFVDIKKGTPVVKHEDGSFTDLQGLPVLPNNITQAVNFRQTRSIEQRQDENNSRNDRFNKKLGFDMAKVSQLSDTQQQALSNSLEVLKTIDRMDELKQNVDTGIISNALNSLLEVVDMAPKGYTELKATSNDSLAKYVKSISGAQVSEMEAKRLGQIIPTTKDNDETFVRKLQTFRQIVNANKDSFVAAIKSGQPLRKIRGLEEAASGLNIRLLSDQEIMDQERGSLIQQYRNEKDPRKRLELGRRIKAMRNR